MSSFSKEMICLVLQFLKEEKFNEVVHKLEQQSGIYFNMKYFEEIVIAGDWDEIEKYLSGFTKVDDNEYSTRIFFELRKQKYLEALDGQDRPKALEILCKDLKVFSTIDEVLYKEIALLLTLNNFREHEKLSKYSVAKTARNMLFIELKKLIKVNPIFGDKLVFPTMKSSRLRTLINQSLNWQHHLCENQRPNPDIKTLFYDHTCNLPNGRVAPVGSLPTNSVPNPVAYTPLGGHAPFPRTASNAKANALARWMTNASESSSVQAAVVAAPSLPIPTNQVAKRHITPPAAQGMIEYQSAEHEPLVKRLRSVQSVEEVSGSSAANLTHVNCTAGRSSPFRPFVVPNGVDSVTRSMEKPKLLDDVNDKMQASRLTEIVDPGQCRIVTMPDSADATKKVARLLYTNSGTGVLALRSNGILNLWKWGDNEQNSSGKASANITPQHWILNNVLAMANDTLGVNLEEAVPCIALSKNDLYVVSAAGGKVSLFDMMTSKTITTFMPPTPTSTSLAFHADDNNIIAIGMEDSTIHIYNVREGVVKSILKGHQHRITGLAFSTNLNILVSSGADAQLCSWNIDSWEKRKTVMVQLSVDKTPNGDTQVQFHSDQVRFLLAHETQLAIYDASTMECIRQWVSQEALSAPISCAAYSCNSELVFASFCDGYIGVFDADTLRLRCRIASSAYLSHGVSNGSQALYHVAVAAHPQVTNQFAVGLTDGSVKVIEPSESEGTWGVSPLAEADNVVLNIRNGSSSSIAENQNKGFGPAGLILFMH